MSSRFLVIPFLLLTLAGCASRGFNRGELYAGLGIPAEANDTEIAKALAVKPQLPKPFRVGVVFQNPEKYGSERPLWRWTDADKEKVLGAARKLQDAKDVSQVFELSSVLAKGGDLRSLRLAAAKHGADALLVVNAVNDTDKYTNDWAWTYIGIVTALFVPASKTDVLFLSRATLWDVRNEFLYLSAEAEGFKEQTRPAAFTDEREAVTAAKEESVAKLTQHIEKMATELTAVKQAAR